jgi:hypothetical protein
MSPHETPSSGHSQQGLEPRAFEGLLADLVEFAGADVVVTISGEKLTPPLIAELFGRLRGAQDLGSSDRYVVEVGEDTRLVLDRSEIRRWWREDVVRDQLVIESGRVRITLGIA